MIFETLSLWGSSLHFVFLLSHFFLSGTTKTKRARSIATLTRSVKSWENLGFAYCSFPLCNNPRFYQKAELSLRLQ